MKRMLRLLPIVGLMLGLVGCKQAHSAATSSSKPKTVVTSKQYTTAQLQKRYVAIVDAVVKPLNMASYTQPTAQIKQAAKAGVTKVDAAGLQLASNTSQPEATQALQKLATAAKTMLTAMNGTDQKAYNADAKAFMDQTSAIAKTYFNGQLPDSLKQYSQRMATKSAATSSSSVASSN